MTTDAERINRARNTWTFDKPNQAGYYWARMAEHSIFSQQDPRVVLIAEDGSFFEYRDGYLEYFGEVSEVSDRMQWAGPIPEPEEP